MSANLLRIAPHLAVGLASVVVGALAHSLLLSTSEASPEKLRATIAQQRERIRSLQMDVDQAKLAAAELNRQKKSGQERLARIEHERDNLERSFRAYRSETERERVEHRQLKDWVHRELQYNTPPANVDDIQAIRAEFDALGDILPTADFHRLENTSAYQKLAEILATLPRAGL
jgi:chromosome segregation ATPase